MGVRDRIIQRYGEVHKEKEIVVDNNEIKKLRKALTPKNNTGKRVIGMLSKGFGDVGKSLATPYSKRRPRISNLSPRKPDISNEPDLSVLRDNDVFGESVRRK